MVVIDGFLEFSTDMFIIRKIQNINKLLTFSSNNSQFQVSLINLNFYQKQKKLIAFNLFIVFGISHLQMLEMTDLHRNLVFSYGLTI